MIASDWSFCVLLGANCEGLLALTDGGFPATASVMYNYYSRLGAIKVFVEIGSILVWLPSVGKCFSTAF